MKWEQQMCGKLPFHYNYHWGDALFPLNFLLENQIYYPFPQEMLWTRCTGTGLLVTSRVFWGSPISEPFPARPRSKSAAAEPSCGEDSGGSGRRRCFCLVFFSFCTRNKKDVLWIAVAGNSLGKTSPSPQSQDIAPFFFAQRWVLDGSFTDLAYPQSARYSLSCISNSDNQCFPYM